MYDSGWARYEQEKKENMKKLNREYENSIKKQYSNKNIGNDTYCNSYGKLKYIRTL